MDFLALTRLIGSNMGYALSNIYRFISRMYKVIFMNVLLYGLFACSKLINILCRFNGYIGISPNICPKFAPTHINYF